MVDCRRHKVPYPCERCLVLNITYLSKDNKQGKIKHDIENLTKTLKTLRKL